MGERFRGYFLGNLTVKVNGIGQVESLEKVGRLTRLLGTRNSRLPHFRPCRIGWTDADLVL